MEVAGRDSMIQQYKSRLHWCCAQCVARDGRDTTFAGVQEHSRITHQKHDTSVENGDIYLHPDSSPMEPEPAWFFSDHYNLEQLGWLEQSKVASGLACFFPFTPRSK
ncbi:hypothetical protein B0H21DRAFT_718882 [Amylocystis lapponica]|nr:hypothetical protein B0H21DRAFT_718882 [Amylocystis lapponica]